MNALILVLLCACSAAPVDQYDAGPDTIKEHAQCAQSCAVCCETQPFVEGIGKTDPIHACSAADLPSAWTVTWCRTDCEAACP
jgi:hypothetical protein